jgi:molybdate transport system ATP-binding protein
LAQLELDITAPLRAFGVDVALTVGAETLALVGPSGAGKTTVLRCVAGLHRPATGRIALGRDTWFDSERGIDRPPDRRSVGLVFQDYALFPHLTVRANVGFGGRARVDELLERLGIAQLAGEKPGQLSGGERQRVAVARALARDPSVLLLDEPLSALDAHTRAGVREQLADLLAELALPSLIVTHDFTDAAALADRVGVVLDGLVHQLGTPAELLARPADEFVASLTGSNLLVGTATPLAGGGAEVRLDDGATLVADEHGSGRVGVAVHPWDVELAFEAPADGERNALAGAIGATTLHGGRARVRVGGLLAETSAPDEPPRGAPAFAVFAPADVRLVPLSDPVPRPRPAGRSPST